MGAPTKILAAMPAADSESDNSSTTSTSSDELFESESGDDASEIRSRKGTSLVPQARVKPAEYHRRATVKRAMTATSAAAATTENRMGP